ncbi:hypothetical protein, partial [Microcoleus sp. herbarium5]|uniref:hypothetical protein n=1 Tax=Microcoleus sp. herbarium5 TaxID=3055434 RepID=UPI002FD66B92
MVRCNCASRGSPHHPIYLKLTHTALYGVILEPWQPCQVSEMSRRSPRVDRTAANFGVLLVENPTKFGRHQ